MLISIQYLLLQKATFKKIAINFLQVLHICWICTTRSPRNDYNEVLWLGLHRRRKHRDCLGPTRAEAFSPEIGILSKITNTYHCFYCNAEIQEEILWWINTIWYCELESWNVRSNSFNLVKLQLRLPDMNNFINVSIIKWRKESFEIESLTI
jgi:hypothetical protein